jgi:hypothetical protein
MPIPENTPNVLDKKGGKTEEFFIKKLIFNKKIF